MRRRRTPLLALTLICAAACEGDGHLRGEVKPSSDGHTYLVIVDDNGGACGDLIVDGSLWQHPVWIPGRITPGVHSIDCVDMEHYDPDNGIRFSVPEGVVFRFDYWGP